MTEIPYDNAKAINRTYFKEKRINKINYKQRYQKDYGMKPLSYRSSSDNAAELEKSDKLPNNSVKLFNAGE